MGNDKTIEIIDGIPHFFLVVPCEPGKPDFYEPLILVAPCKCGRKLCKTTRYQCRECGWIFHSRRSWEKHKGIHWMTPKVSCPGKRIYGKNNRREKERTARQTETAGTKRTTPKDRRATETNEEKIGAK